MLNAPDNLSPAMAVSRCQKIFAHAWMVRTFVKHSEEVEQFPELMQVVRTVFDTCRALEPKVETPVEYLATLRKKIGKFRGAVTQFATDAPIASDHTNFRQAVISLQNCLEELESVLQLFPAPAPPPMPASFRPRTESVNVSEADDLLSADGNFSEKH